MSLYFRTIDGVDIKINFKTPQRLLDVFNDSSPVYTFVQYGDSSTRTRLNQPRKRIRFDEDVDEDVDGDEDENYDNDSERRSTKRINFLEIVENYKINNIATEGVLKSTQGNDKIASIGFDRNVVVSFFEWMNDILSHDLTECKDDGDDTNIDKIVHLNILKMIEYMDVNLNLQTNKSF